ASRSRDPGTTTLSRPFAGASGATRTGTERAPSRRFAALLAGVFGLILAGIRAVRATPARREPPVATRAASPLPLAPESRGRGAAGAETRPRRIAATFAELLSEQLRIGDGTRIPDADTRVAMLEASGLDPSQPVLSPALLSHLHAATGAEV